jgi:hypothetical protein
MNDATMGYGAFELRDLVPGEEFFAQDGTPGKVTGDPLAKEWGERLRACGHRRGDACPGFPRWLDRFGMAFAPFPWKTQRFRRLPAETIEEPNG